MYVCMYVFSAVSVITPFDHLGSFDVLLIILLYLFLLAVYCVYDLFFPVCMNIVLL